MDITSISPNYDVAVAEALEQRSLPACFGNMILPTLNNTTKVDLADYFKARATVDPAEIHTGDLKGLLPQLNDFAADDLVLTKQAYKEISEYKKEIVAKYVDQAISCFNCEKVDLCYKLTQNTLQYMSIQKEL